MDIYELSNRRFRDFYFEPDEMAERIDCLVRDLQRYLIQLEQEEKYEQCQVVKDTIADLKGLADPDVVLEEIWNHLEVIRMYVELLGDIDRTFEAEGKYYVLWYTRFPDMRPWVFEITEREFVRIGMMLARKNS